MRTRSAARLLLFALLAFQLAFGLQQSVGAPHPETTGYVDVTQDAGHGAGAIAAHDIDVEHSVGAAHHGATPRHDLASGSMTADNDGSCPHHSAPAPDNKHDCCKSSACQCQCGYVSLAATLDGPKGIPASTQVQPITTVRFATAPADTLFRPPIRA